MARSAALLSGVEYSVVALTEIVLSFFVSSPQSYLSNGSNTETARLIPALDMFHDG
jgi:hypothetical protein